MEQFEDNERRRKQQLQGQGDGEDADSDDDEDTKDLRRLEAGAYSQQRLAVVMVITAAHSSAVAGRVDAKLHQVCEENKQEPRPTGSRVRLMWKWMRISLRQRDVGKGKTVNCAPAWHDDGSEYPVGEQCCPDPT